MVVEGSGGARSRRGRSRRWAGFVKVVMVGRPGVRRRRIGLEWKGTGAADCDCAECVPGGRERVAVRRAIQLKRTILVSDGETIEEKNRNMQPEKSETRGCSVYIRVFTALFFSSSQQMIRR